MGDADYTWLVRRYTSYHEAGHAVVALSLGVKVSRVWIDAEGGCTELEHARHLHPDGAWEYAKSPAHMSLLLRDSLLLYVAGQKAKHLYQQWDLYAEWPTSKQLREEDDEWAISSEELVSSRLATGDLRMLRDKDVCQVWKGALGIWSIGLHGGRKRWRRNPQPLPVEDPVKEAIRAEPRAKVILEQQPLPVEDLVKEALRAERRAEKILKKHWQVVTDIAQTLQRYKSGRLTHGRLMKLVGGRVPPALAG